MTPVPRLARHLGLAAVAAIVVGNMLGSGIFFTPGELAAVATAQWQVHFIWVLCGVITLCGALTLAELATLLPHAGASYHIIRDAFGPLAGFWLVWLELWVSGPGAVAGIAVALGDFVHRATGSSMPAVGWGVAAIGFFAAVNLAGVQWGGRTQVFLTAVKVLGIAALVGGAAFAATSLGVVAPTAAPIADTGGPAGFLRFVGLGIAAVLFTYDGWIDVSHVAGEVRRPGRDLPIGLGLGVAATTVLYLAVNYAYLSVIPLEAMRAAPTTIATTLATATFGPVGAQVLNGLLVVSIFGALGGLVLTLPRLFYTLAATYTALPRPPALFRLLATVSPRTAVPSGAILFSAATAIAALVFFGSFSRLVNFFVVPLQLANILMVTAIFRLRKATPEPGAYRTPGFPVTPLGYVVVMAGFLVSAVIARPFDTLSGLALSATAVPVYIWMKRSR